MTELITLRLVDIEPNPDNPRKHFDAEALEQLAASICEVGVLQPLVVVPIPSENGDLKQYRIVCGERRWRAARMAGIKTVPAIVKEHLMHSDIRQIMLIENIQRQDLDPIEEARALHQLTTDHGWKQTDLAERIGVSQSHIANRIRLLRLPESVQQNISAGIIPSSVGKELVAYAGRVDLDKLAKEAVKKSWTTTQVIDAAKNQAWQNTKPLHRDQGWPQPEFNLGACEGCSDRTDMAKPWGSDGNKVPRCLKPECWEEKQKAALQAREDERRQKAVEVLKDGGHDVSDVLDMSGRDHGSYEQFSSYTCSFDRAECAVCSHRAWGIWPYSREASEICFNPECFREKQRVVVEARDRERAAGTAAFEARKLEIVNGAMEWDQPLLHFLAAQMLLSEMGAECNVFEHLEQRFNWELPEDLYDDASIEVLLERLQSLPAAELRRIILYVLVMSIRDDDPLWRSFFANWEPPAVPPDEKSPEEINQAWADETAKLTDEEVKQAGIERVLGHIANSWIEKQIIEAINRGEDAAQAAKKAVGASCSGYGGPVGYNSHPKGLTLKSIDDRSFEVTWREIVDYVKGKIRQNLVKTVVEKLETIENRESEADDPEPEPICTGPIGKIYRDNHDREIFVSQGLGAEYGTFWRQGQSLHRVRSTKMPMVRSAALAQENLDRWARDNECEEVVQQ